MTDIAQLAIEVKSDGVVQAQRNLDGLEREARKAETASQRLERQFKQVERAAARYGRTLSTYVTAPLVAMGTAAVVAFGRQESAELRLRAALQANGREVERLFSRYNDFAREMQRVTVIGDEVTLAMLQQAESLGLTGEAAERAVRNSIAMQSAFGTNAQSALRYTAALEEGNATMLTRYLPALRDISDQSEQAAEAQRLLGNAFSVAKAEAESMTGAVAQMRNAMGDAFEEVGRVIAPTIIELATRIQSLAEQFRDLDPATQRLIVQSGALAAAIGPLLLSLSMLMRTLMALRPLIVFMAGPAGLVAMAAAAGVFIGHRLDRHMRDVADGTKGLSDEVRKAAGAWTEFNDEVAEAHRQMIQMNMDRLEAEMDQWVRSLALLGRQATQAQINRITELQDEYQKWAARLEQNTRLTESNRRVVEESAEAVESLAGATGGSGEETERAASEWQRFGGILNRNLAVKVRLLQILRDANPELDEFGQFAQRAENHFGNLTWEADIFMRLIERLQAVMMRGFKIGVQPPDRRDVEAIGRSISADLARSLSFALSADQGASMGRSIGNALRTTGMSGIQDGLQDALTKAFEELDLESERMMVAFVAIGEAIAGNMGAALGTALGGTIGAIFGGPAGAMIGATIGNAIGGIFGRRRRPKFQLGGTGGGFAGTGAGRTDMAVNTALGQTMFRFRGIERQAQLQLRDAIQGMDAALAGIIRDEGQLAQMRQAIAQFGHDSRDEGATLQDVLEARFRAIIGTFDSFTRDIVMAGADLEEQFQRLADIVQIGARQNLGDNLGITWNDEHPIWMAHELARAGETLAQSFQRLLTITDALDTAVALTGNNLHGTRDEVIRFGDALMAAFGDDLQRLTRGLNTVFGAFFSDEERLNVAADQARQRAADLFERLGIDAADAMFTESGFRALFDSLFGTLDAESTAVLIEAGVAVSALIDAERELAELRGEVVGSVDDLSAQLETLMAGIDRDLLRIISPARAQFSELAARISDAYTQAIALGASEAELARIRELHHRSMQRMINDLTMSILRLADDLFGVEDAYTDIGNAIVRSTENIRDAVIRSLERIDQWLDRSMLANFSPLTPTERLNEAQAQFDAAFKAATQQGDWDALANLPALADALLGEGAGFFGTSTAQFRELFDMVRGMMEQASGLTPPAEMQPPTFGQVEAIRSDASAFRIRLDELEQMQRAWQLGDQIGTLAELTEQTPYELARSLGFTDANMRQLLEALGHEIPHGTGLELADYFNDVVREIDRQNPIARSIRDANQLLADHIGSMIGILELSLFAIGDVLVQILHQLGGEYVAPPWLPQYALGGPVHRTEPALVHQEEWVVPRNGALVMSDSKQQTAILERMDNRLRNLERINSGGFATVADEERRTRQSMSARRETARV